MNAHFVQLPSPTRTHSHTQTHEIFVLILCVSHIKRHNFPALPKLNDACAQLHTNHADNQHLGTLCVCFVGWDTTSASTQATVSISKDRNRWKMTAKQKWTNEHSDDLISSSAFFFLCINNVAVLYARTRRVVDATNSVPSLQVILRWSLSRRTNFGLLLLFIKFETKIVCVQEWRPATNYRWNMKIQPQTCTTTIIIIKVRI